MSLLPERSQNRVVQLLTCHPVAALGTALATLAGFSWLFLMPLQLSGHVENPYIGILAFIVLPAVFFVGLTLIPIGASLARHNPAIAMRRTGLFFVIMTGANLLIGSQLTYRAVTHMDSVQFCGQSCHAMTPEYSWSTRSIHAKVECAECHVVPGAAGWFKAKTAGTRQLFEATLNTFPHPIPGALASGRLARSEETCERCHNRGREMGIKLVVRTKYGDDEKSTPSRTVLSMMVGGGRLGGIHGAHMSPGLVVTYAAKDNSRETIPWVEVADAKGTRTFSASGLTPEELAKLPKFQMECADCHNRIGHHSPTLEEAVDRALEDGSLSRATPFARRDAIAMLKDPSAKLTPELQKIAAANVFPDLKLSWGAYKSNVGHDGCTRCHDGDHSTADKAKTVPQDCETCHKVLAVEEPMPEIVTTLGLPKTN